MNYIKVTKENIDQEHFCCAISNTTSDNRVLSKKDWMKTNFEHGLTFIKLDDRGKVFIEYIPSEKAWSPIIAPNTLFINCFWVSGKFVHQGHGTNLLNRCIEDAIKQEKDGIVVLSSVKKMPFLSDPVFLKHKGFIVSDTLGYFELLYLPINQSAPSPKFCEHVKQLKIASEDIVIYYSNQCPHAEMYTKMIEEMAIEKNVPIHLIKLESYVDAQNSPAPFSTYSFFDKGQFITNEIFGPKKFEKYLKSR